MWNVKIKSLAITEIAPFIFANCPCRLNSIVNRSGKTLLWQNVKCYVGGELKIDWNIEIHEYNFHLIYSLWRFAVLRTSSFEQHEQLVLVLSAKVGVVWQMCMIACNVLVKLQFFSTYSIYICVCVYVWFIIWSRIIGK